MNKEWLSDFENFMKEDSATVPDPLTKTVLFSMNKLLNPDPKSIFTKILVTQTIVGFISLAFCHQFGINPFQTRFSLDTLFMGFGGHGACMIFCGFFFISPSLAIAGYFFTIEEVRTLKRTKFPQIFAVTVISLTIFALFGAELALTFTGLWMLGALIGGYVTTQLVWFLRSAQKLKIS